MDISSQTTPAGDIPMTRAIKVYKENAIKCLSELADYDYQKKVWATGKPRLGDRSVDFVEGCCSLFDDTGLGDALAAGQVVFGDAADQAIWDLHDATNKVDYRNKPSSAIVDIPAMQTVREKAARALQLILQSHRHTE